MERLRGGANLAAIVVPATASGDEQEEGKAEAGSPHPVSLGPAAADGFRRRRAGVARGRERSRPPDHVRPVRRGRDRLRQQWWVLAAALADLMEQSPDEDLRRRAQDLRGRIKLEERL
jgi:hypothetical protein